MWHSRRARRTFFTTLIALAILIPATVIAAGPTTTWPSAGMDLNNTRYNDTERTISPANVGGLWVAWEFTTGGDVSATPAVDKTTIYFPDAGGNLFALDRNTGAVVWQKTITGDYGLPGDPTYINPFSYPANNYARTTPVIAGNKLIFGDQGGKFGVGATVLAVSKQTGELLWKTKVEDNFSAIVTQSAIWDDRRNIVYVGVASNEEAFAALIPGYSCCSFRGSMVALDGNTGAILWKTYMAPDGYSGNAVWGSTPVIDRSRNSLYLTTGNNYTVPSDVAACIVAAGGNPEAERACIAPDDYFDSIVALDLSTGAVRWAHQALPFDAWVVSCILDIFGNQNCPDPAGPDYDFGQGPALFSVRGVNGKRQDLLGAGQKSGQYWALNPNDGSVAWVTQTGPGGTAGGLQWGSATDGTRIFTANANSDHKTWELIQNGVPSGVTTNGGVWSALDAATGQVLWQVANPNLDPFFTPTPEDQIPDVELMAGSTAPVTLANGVVYGCSLDAEGHMYAFDAATGAMLWQFSSPSSGSCAAGPAVVNGTVYWGSGYGGFFGIPGSKMRAFRGGFVKTTP